MLTDPVGEVGEVATADGLAPRLRGCAELVEEADRLLRGVPGVLCLTGDPSATQLLDTQVEQMWGALEGIDAALDEKEQKIEGRAKILYTNNSPGRLDYLWIYLEQNAFRPDSLNSLMRENEGRFGNRNPFSGGVSVTSCKVAGQETPIAIDEDGTLLCANRGFILALRPFVGDFNGDGTITCGDASAFSSALTNYSAWDQNYGQVYGINVLGVGDCDNDGLFNNFDIDCFTAILCGSCTSSICEEEGFQGSYDPDAQEAAEIIIALRILYGMD